MMKKIIVGVFCLALAVPDCAFAQGGANTVYPPAQIPGSLVSGNLVVGGPGQLQIQDSGNVPVKQYIGTVNPTGNDDSTQGYIVGSLGVNQTTGALFVLTNATAGAAVWTALNAVPPTTFEQSIGWVQGNLATNSTNYCAPGGAGCGPNQNYGIFATITGTLQHLYLRTAAAPGTGNSYIATVFLGSPGAMTQTPISCPINDTNQSCTDLTHTAAITAGQFWSVKVVTSTSAAATAANNISLGLLPQ
jgi:hypothetical protein